jgi:hypothetical protein
MASQRTQIYGLHGVISHKMVLFTTTTVRATKPTHCNTYFQQNIATGCSRTFNMMNPKHYDKSDTDGNIYKSSTAVLFPIKHLIQNTQRHYEIHFVLLPACRVAISVQAVCKYCSSVWMRFKTSFPISF